MARYTISGVWKNSSLTITHYAFHLVDNNGYPQRAEKVSKVDAIARLEKQENTAITWLWDYQKSNWVAGETVQVVGTGADRYLRSNADNRTTDNLAHLINYLWIIG